MTILNHVLIINIQMYLVYQNVLLNVLFAQKSTGKQSKQADRWTAHWAAADWTRATAGRTWQFGKVHYEEEKRAAQNWSARSATNSRSDPARKRSLIYLIVIIF